VFYAPTLPSRPILCGIVQFFHVFSCCTAYGTGCAQEIKAATYFCPCGYAGHVDPQCTCSPVFAVRYQKRISGPLIDRSDIHGEVSRVNYDKLASEQQGESSSAVRERVTTAHVRQAERFKGTRMLTNADMRPAEVRLHCQARRRQPAAAAGSNAPVAPLGACLPPRAQAGAHDR
jgi:hypothetical protein